MDDIILAAKNRNKNKRQHLLTSDKREQKAPSKYIAKLFERTLLSIILVLITAIYINLSDKNLLYFKNKIFNDTLVFAKINEMYTKYFGPLVKEKIPATTPVFNEQNNLKIEEYNDSYKVSLPSNHVLALESGIVVFQGEKEGLGKTIIVQGVDGVDIWYSNLENVNWTLYDYVSKKDGLGTSLENTIIYTFMENGKYIGYENYLNEM